MSETVVTVNIRCKSCEHPKARVVKNAGHLTARCLRCDTYIKHLSKDEFRGLMNPHENALRGQIKDLVALWCANKSKEIYEGWQHLYRCFNNEYSYNLLDEAKKLKEQPGWKKATGVDAADELGMLEQLHDIAVANCDQDADRIYFPEEIQRKVHDELPRQFLQLLQAYGWNIFGVFELVKGEIALFEQQEHPHRIEECTSETPNVVTAKRGRKK